MRDVNHMIISVEKERALDNIQRLFMIKTLSKVEIEGTYLNVIKAIHDRPTANIILSGQKLTSISLNIATKTWMSALTTLIQHSTGSPATAIRQEEEIKGIQIRKEEVKMSLFVDDIILYIENPKDSNKKLVELINKCSKLAGYKINIQKAVAFLCTNNEPSEREPKKTI